MNGDEEKSGGDLSPPGLVDIQDTPPVPVISKPVRAGVILEARRKQAMSELKKQGEVAVGDSVDENATFVNRRGTEKAIKKTRSPKAVIDKMMYRLTGVNVGGVRYNCIFDAAVQVLLNAMGEVGETGKPTDRALKAAAKILDIALPQQKAGNDINVNVQQIDVTVEALQKVKEGIRTGEVRDIFRANAKKDEPPMLGLGKEPPALPLDVFVDIPKPPEKIFISGFSDGYEKMEPPVNGNGHSKHFNEARGIDNG